MKVSARPIEALFRPRSVAVVGASPRAGSAGNNIIQNLLDRRYSGAIYPVNPRYEEICGLMTYKTLADIGKPVDTVFIAVAAEYGLDIMKQAAAIGARAVLLNATGYADAGQAGAAKQAELLAIALEHDIAVCGPNNLGMINVLDGVPLWTAHMSDVKAGSVAIVSQSGSVALALGDDPAGLGLSHIITAGNEAVCGVADYVDYLADDERVRTILLFLETIRDPARLAAAAGRAKHAGKQLFAVKVGRSEQARAAVAAHSGALSGEDVVVDAYFRKHGIERCIDLDDMVQRAALSLKSPPRPGTSAVYLTLSGGQAAAIADCSSDVDLEVSGLPAHLAQSLTDHFHGYAPGNPMDVWGLGWDPARFGKILQQLVAAPEVNPIVLTLDIPASGAVDGPMGVDMARAAAEHAGDKQVIFVGNSAISGIHPDIAGICRENGFPVLLGIAGAMRAIATWSRSGNKKLPTESSAAAEAGRLSKDDLQKALRKQVRFVETAIVSNANEAAVTAEKVGYPVVLKGMAPNALHKTELGLVRVGLGDAGAVRRAYDDLERILKTHATTLGQGTVQLEPMIAGGIEVLVAGRRDPQFGPMVLFGAGGKLVELVADSVLRLGAVTAEEAIEMIGETRVATLLGGYRDGVAFDLDAVRNAIVAVSKLMVEAGPDVNAVEINPLIVMPKGQGAVAVDLVIE
ncbi:acetate--CoA ligase family protein [Rhizobium laguerreae]|uniref:Acetate--CoA ligase family protein n=1 Tax=Rhizobium laguerreae TaxID=1076926 RepID=A0AB35FDW9_9HYPH|nr:acetate--CoA ligase family protein [Rhizobium laguerreae]MBY3064537.1 acetate--CoA ligase family protein [Rhizobium laguerreae]